MPKNKPYPGESQKQFKVRQAAEANKPNRRTPAKIAKKMKKS